MNSITLFCNQKKPDDKYLEYRCGTVTRIDGRFVVGFNQIGAEEYLFSIGQPVYDDEGNVMGFLGIGLYRHLDFYTGEMEEEKRVRIPAYYWEICLPTEHCKEFKRIRSHWQHIKERKNGQR